MIDKIGAILRRLERFIFSTIMFFMLCILSVHVVMRYVFNSPIIWTDEVTTILQSVIAYLGIGYCFRRRQHTEVTFFYEKMSPVIQKICRIITDSTMLFCLYQIILASFKYVAKQNIALGTVSWLRLSYFYALIPVGFIIAALTILVDLIVDLAPKSETVPKKGSQILTENH